MLYHWCELSHAAVQPARRMADTYRLFIEHPLNPIGYTAVGRHAAAACEVFERTTRRYPKPKFNITTTCVDGSDVDVFEHTIWRTPFCRLKRFARNIPKEQNARDPRLLIVAPMSGHYATLLRGTVETLLPNHDVYITDWQDASTIPVQDGTFGLESYISHIIDMLRLFQGDVHVFGVCQPSVPVLAACAIMDAENDPSIPHSLIMAGGPIDTRQNPTAVNDIAVERGIEWFRNNALATVPRPHAGAGRRVYPGFLQLSGFMAMNLNRHLTAHKALFLDLIKGDGDSADRHREFYDEYLAVMDLTAEFYIETVEQVFIKHALPKGELNYKDQAVDLNKVTRIPIMTIEGEKDDITGLGQCRAALNLTPNLPEIMKLHCEVRNVGHYGIFNGRRFQNEIAPKISQFVRNYDSRADFIEASHPESSLLNHQPQHDVANHPQQQIDARAR